MYKWFCNKNVIICLCICFACNYWRWKNIRNFIWKISTPDFGKEIPQRLRVQPTGRLASLGIIHTEKSFRNLIKSTWNQIVFTIFRLIWFQTDVRLVPNQSVHGKYNLISGWFNKIFVCVWIKWAGWMVQKIEEKTRVENLTKVLDLIAWLQH